MHWQQVFPAKARAGFTVLAHLNEDFGRALRMLGGMYSNGLMDEALLLKAGQVCITKYCASIMPDLALRLGRVVPGREVGIIEVANALEQAKIALRQG